MGTVYSLQRDTVPVHTYEFSVFLLTSYVHPIVPLTLHADYYAVICTDVLSSESQKSEKAFSLPLNANFTYFQVQLRGFVAELSVLQAKLSC